MVKVQPASGPVHYEMKRTWRDIRVEHAQFEEEFHQLLTELHGTSYSRSSLHERVGGYLSFDGEETVSIWPYDKPGVAYGIVYLANSHMRNNYASTRAKCVALFAKHSRIHCYRPEYDPSTMEHDALDALNFIAQHNSGALLLAALAKHWSAVRM